MNYTGNTENQFAREKTITAMRKCTILETNLVSNGKWAQLFVIRWVAQ